jgi:uncharacterized membrane protein
VKWFPEVDDATVEQERRTSWPLALAIALVVAVVFAAIGALLSWAMGAGWVRGAVMAFCAALLSLVVTRVRALSRARRDRR